MRIVKTNATVTKDGTITVRVPPDIPTGNHQVVLVIDEVLNEANGDQPRPLLDLTAYPVGLISDDFTFRREDLYHDG